MKTRLIAIIVAAISAAFLTGCGTVPSGTASQPFIGTDTNGFIYVQGHKITPESVGSILESGAQLGATQALNSNPDAKTYLEAAHVVITLAIADKNYDPEKLAAALAAIPAKEAQDPTVVAGINAALAVYNALYGQVVAAKLADASPYLVPALAGIRDGIGIALAGYVPPETKPAP